MGHCQGETPCKCFTSELSWAILSYLELSWAILKWWTKYTKSNNQTINRPCAAIYWRAICLVFMQHGRAAPTSLCSSGTSLEFRSSSGTSKLALLRMAGEQSVAILSERWKNSCLKNGCWLNIYCRCWWSFWIVLLHTIFHRNQKVTGALPKMAISCTTPTDILTYCTFWIVTSCNIHKSKSYRWVTNGNH